MAVLAYDAPPSAQFLRTVGEVLDAVKLSPNPGLVAAYDNVPILSQPEVLPSQAKAAACVDCKILGLWAKDWPGYQQYPYGVIWLFEKGIAEVAAKKGITLKEQVTETVIHELGHSLGMDHGMTLNNFVRTEMGALR